MKVIRVIPFLKFAAPAFFNAAGNPHGLLDAGLLGTNPILLLSSTQIHRVGAGLARPRCALMPRSSGVRAEPNFEIRGGRSSAAM
jgi:hypothetical protein